MWIGDMSGHLHFAGQHRQAARIVLPLVAEDFQRVAGRLIRAAVGDVGPKDVGEFSAADPSQQLP
jgi:hypothetical protein